MERHYMEVIVYLDLPNGETPTIDASWKASKKVATAVKEVLNAGKGTDFTIGEMDIDGDGSGIVVTHKDAV